MALTISLFPSEFGARRQTARLTIGAAGDYSSGVTITPSAFGQRVIVGASVIASSVGAVWNFDPTNGKLRGYVQGAGAGLLTEITGAQAAGAVLVLETVDGM